MSSFTYLSSNRALISFVVKLTSDFLSKSFKNGWTTGTFDFSVWLESSIRGWTLAAGG